MTLPAFVRFTYRDGQPLDLTLAHIVSIEHLDDDTTTVTMSNGRGYDIPAPLDAVRDAIVAVAAAQWDAEFQRKLHDEDPRGRTR